MPRTGRNAAGGYIYHVYNCAQGRSLLFRGAKDYQAFIEMMAAAHERLPVPVVGFCLMPNHWHMILVPKKRRDLSSFLLRLTTAHARQRLGDKRAGGHLYEGRFKSFPIERGASVVLALRYVEANPLRARLVKNPAKWKWSSYAARQGDNGELVTKSPKLPAGCGQKLLKMDEKDLERVRTCCKRGRPLGSDAWVKQTARKLGLRHTLRPRGRPRKKTVIKK